MGTPAALRADAARNREVILAAAREVFGELGLEAPIDEIARRAGIGNATLYRRFPSRADLVVAVFADRMLEHVQAVEQALVHPDPWEGFRRYVLAVCAMQARDRGIADLVTMDVSMAPEIEQVRARGFHALVQLVDRVKAAGALRADFTPEDIVVVLMANAGLVGRAHDAAPQASERLIHVLLDGFRADAATDGPPPPSPRRMRRAMRQHSRAVGFAPRQKKTTEPTEA